MTAEQAHRFALTGHNLEGRNRTIVLWREADLVEGRVVRRVVLTLDATLATATVLTCPEAIEVAQAMLAAAQGSTAAQQDCHGRRFDRPLEELRPPDNPVAVREELDRACFGPLLVERRSKTAVLVRRADPFSCFLRNVRRLI